MYPAEGSYDAAAGAGDATADSGVHTVKAPAAIAVPLPIRKSRLKTVFALLPSFLDLDMVVSPQHTMD